MAGADPYGPINGYPDRTPPENREFPVAGLLLAGAIVGGLGLMAGASALGAYWVGTSHLVFCTIAGTISAVFATVCASEGSAKSALFMGCLGAFGAGAFGAALSGKVLPPAPVTAPVFGTKLKPEFKGACDKVKVVNGQYVLTKGCKAVPAVTK